MADQKNRDHLHGVKCSAVMCRYHCPDSGCQASGIQVGAEGSTNSADTYCMTFTPQGR